MKYSLARPGLSRSGLATFSAARLRLVGRVSASFVLSLALLAACTTKQQTSNAALDAAATDASTTGAISRGNVDAGPTTSDASASLGNGGLGDACMSESDCTYVGGCDVNCIKSSESDSAGAKASGACTLVEVTSKEGTPCRGFWIQFNSGQGSGDVVTLPPSKPKRIARCSFNDGLFCDERPGANRAVCSRFLPLGAPCGDAGHGACGPDAECPWGRSQVCVARPTKGESCAKTDCARGYRCSAAKKCEPERLASLGQACTTPDSCAPKLSCIKSKCVAEEPKPCPL